MKKILLGILALAAVACNNDVVVNEQAPSAITFGDSFVEVKTRGAEDPSTTTASINAFDVWGFIEQPSGTIFNQERVTRDANGWSYNNIQWWFPSKNYYFHAISPVDDANIVVNTANMNSYGLGNIAFTNVDGTTDLLYSSKHVETDSTDPYYENASTGNKVSMQFMHLLSKIKFTFTNGFVTDNISVKVTDLKIVDAPAKGNVDVNIEKRLDYVWNLVQGETTTLEFGDVNGGNALAATASAECAVERLTIPADATRSYTIEFDVEVFCGTESGVKTHKVVTLENQAFAIGKNYNIVAVLNNENVGDDALLPIEFDVITVEDWVENDFNGNLDYDNDQNNPSNPSEPVASEWALVGAFSSWIDKAMLTTADADVVVLEDVALKAAEGFLVRKPSTDWADKYGAGNVNYLKANHYITTLKDGADMCVEADGTYDVYFNISTKNLYVMEADANYAEATEQTVNGEEPKQEEPEVTEKVVYLKPNTNWTTDGARFAAYFWINDTTNAWVSMTAIEDGIYQVNLPEGYDYGCNVIFCRMNPNTTANNWNNKWNQTGDLKVPTDGKNLFTLPASAWDGATASWSVYTPAVVEPVALATPVVTATVSENTVTLAWAAVENADKYSVTVGTEMPVFVEDTTYTFTGDYETEYTFAVVAVPADEENYAVSEAAIVKATTEAEPVVGPTYTTVAEFLAAAEDESATAPMYTLKGTITAVANDYYGNFDLTDDTGTVYIYGLCSPDGATQKYWATSGAKLGDDIVIKTVRTSFNGSAQGKNAWFVELVSPGTRAFYTVDPAAVDFASAGGEQDIEVFAYNTTAGVTATSDNDAFTVAVNGYVVTVTAAANELEQDVTGNITIKVGDLEATVVKATLAAKPASGVVEGGSDDFHTISATNTSYVTGKTTAGWNYKNCAIFKGGTSDSSPAFKMIGDANNRALCMNGKTSGVGSITSPTLTTGCGTLKFNYGLPFSDTQMKFRVDIMQDGAVVKTFTVTETSASKYTKYSHEEVINVAGDFQIVFTNLSPSNSSSNKDRTAIWDVEWTGYNN